MAASLSCFEDHKRRSAQELALAEDEASLGSSGTHIAIIEASSWLQGFSYTFESNMFRRISYKEDGNPTASAIGP